MSAIGAIIALYFIFAFFADIHLFNSFSRFFNTNTTLVWSFFKLPLTFWLWAVADYGQKICLEDRLLI